MGTNNPMTALGILRDALATVPGVVTCKIGLEASMTAQDYPMVRIVPSLVRYGPVMGQRATDVLVYFGKPLAEFDAGLEGLYAELFAMEGALIDKAQSCGVYCQYVETVADEDRTDAYKLMALRLSVAG